MTRSMLNLPPRLRLACLVTALALAPIPLWAQSGITEQSVQFPRGKTGTTIQGSLRGDETVDYKLRAAAGQEMKVRLEPGTVYFNVLPPGSNDVALFVGSRDGDSFGGTLSADGEYRIRVYQMGNAKSSGKRTNFTIELAHRNFKQRSAWRASSYLRATPPATRSTASNGRASARCGADCAAASSTCAPSPLPTTATSSRRSRSS